MKKTIALFLAVVSLVSLLAGCGGASDPTTAAPNTTVAPDTTAAPGTTAAPSTTGVPETTVPETTVPETTVPETTVPETTVPETTVPEATEGTRQQFNLRMDEMLFFKYASILNGYFKLEDTCERVTIYDEQFEKYITFTCEYNFMQGYRYVFESYSDSFEEGSCCFAEVDSTKQLTVTKHKQAYKDKYPGYFKSNYGACKLAVYDEELQKYVLFENCFVALFNHKHVFAGVVDTYDSAAYCLATVDIANKTLTVLEHTASEQTERKLAKKYADGLSYSENIGSVAVYDEEYDVYARFYRSSTDKYKFSDYTAELDSFYYSHVTVNMETMEIVDVLSYGVRQKYSGDYTADFCGCSDLAVYSEEDGVYVIFEYMEIDQVYHCLSRAESSDGYCVATADMDAKTLTIHSHNATKQQSDRLLAKYAGEFVVTGGCGEAGCDVIAAYDAEGKVYVFFQHNSGGKYGYIGYAETYTAAKVCIGSVDVTTKTIQAQKHSAIKAFADSMQDKTFTGVKTGDTVVLAVQEGEKTYTVEFPAREYGDDTVISVYHGETQCYLYFKSTDQGFVVDGYGDALPKGYVGAINLETGMLTLVGYYNPKQESSEPTVDLH